VDLSRALPPHPTPEPLTKDPHPLWRLDPSPEPRICGQLSGSYARIGRPRRAWVTTAVRERPSQVTQDERLRPRVTTLTWPGLITRRWPGSRTYEPSAPGGRRVMLAPRR
jgi:hypothetical protein